MELKGAANQYSNYGKLYPNLLNDKTWEEEKTEFYNKGVELYTAPIRLGKIKSCEVISLCETINQNVIELRDKKGFWNHYGRSGSTPKELDLGEYSLEEILERLENIFNGGSTPEEERTVNKCIDGFGTSACEPRAFLENLGKEENHDNNLNIPKIKSVNYTPFV